ncbi:MAG: hypothetical protein K2X48_03510 [Chitinophagaceae bacterium]|nr:hypothetical protein [Chitinophagaceae bacterium]
MQEQAKISLSAFELQLVSDAGIILTKNNIIQKVYELFGKVSDAYQKQLLNARLPKEAMALSPKISKGENYKGLPYVMLDYPRCFGKEDVFAVRSFFWWGNYFSSVLQLKGMYKAAYELKIMNAISNGQLNGYYINNSNEEWNHDIHTADAELVTAPSILSPSHQVIKITSVHELAKWDTAFDFFQNQLQLYLQILND